MPKFHVDEHIEIDAPAAKVKAVIRDFQQWKPWSPWLSAEPDCALDYAEDGKSYAWKGKVIGEGRMELRKEEEHALWYHLTFLTPWKSESDVDFQILSQGPERSKVHWRMDGSLPFFMFFMKNKMKSWIGGDYRRGLLKLKDFVEQGSVPSQNEFPGVRAGINTRFIGYRQKVSMPQMAESMAKQFPRLAKLLSEKGLAPSGQPFSIYHEFDIVRDRCDYTAAIPVAQIPEGLDPEVIQGSLDVARSFQVVHKGAYRHLGNAWSAGMMHQRSKTFASHKSKDPFEVYENDPTSTPEPELLTTVHFPAQ